MSNTKFEEDTPKSFDLESIAKRFTSIIQRIRLRSSIAFNFTYENDGRDVVNNTEVTADGSETSSGSHHLGTDNRNPYYSLFIFKTTLITAIKLTTWPFKWAINFLKFGTEDLPLTLEGVSEDLSNYMGESFSSVWNTKQAPYDSRHPAVFGFVKLVKLAFFGSLFLGSYLSNWAFSIVHKFGMALTSPDKSRRYWFTQGYYLSQTTFLGYIPGSSYILPYILSGLSIAFSTLAWAVTFPLAVSAVTTFFPAVLPVVTSLTKLPFIASSLTMISGTVISVSTTIAGIIAPVFAAINVIAATVGIQVTATSLAVGFSLGAVAAFLSIVLTYIADKTFKMWATSKGTDTVELLKEEMRLAHQKKLNILGKDYNDIDDEPIDVAIKSIFDTNSSVKLEDSCCVAAQAIYDFIRNKEAHDRRVTAANIEKKIYSYQKNNVDFKASLKILEKQLKIKFQAPENSTLNWKDIIYDANYTKAIGARSTKFEVNFDSLATIDSNGRQKESSINREDRTNPDSNIAAATTGTTFFTNSQQVLARSEKSALNSNLSVTHVMDSCLVAHKSYENNMSRRIYLAMADGLGGHTGDKAEDTRISRASYFGCKHAIRLCSTYDDADTLKANLKKIIKNVGDEILLKNKAQRESTSLTCATVFPVSEGWGRPLKQRVVGANIGDSMLVAWNPKTNTVSTLLPGHHLVQNIGQGPAHLPANYNLDTDLDMVDVTLEHGTVLIPFTDGMLGHFNTITKQEIKNGKNYKVYEINPNWIEPILRILNRNHSAKEIVATLMQHVMEQAESDRRTLNQEAETAKTDLADLTETQKADRETLAEEKKVLDGKSKAIWDQKEKKEISDQVYSLMRNPLQQQRFSLDQRTSDLNVKLSALEAKTQIRSGDDIAVMAVRLQ